MALDPEFAVTPFTYPKTQYTAESMRTLAELMNSPEWIREDIAGLEHDIRCDQETIDHIRVEIPRLQHEFLEKERDIAVNKLKVIELRAKLAAKNGGQR